MRLSLGRCAVFTAVAITAALAASAFASASKPSAFRHAPLRISSAPDHQRNSTSSNWSGYAVTGGKYTSVSASWVQPAVNCTVTPTGYAAFWIGLDGDTTNTVEQTGSEGDCSSGKAVYYAWNEMYPKFPTNYTNPVKAGDSFSSTVTTDGNGNFTLTLHDSTQNWTQTVTAKLKNAKLGSAEVIAEAPSSGGVLPLADFGSVGFTSATANGKSFYGQSGLDQINMASGSTLKATTSSMSSGGNFSVTWDHS